MAKRAPRKAARKRQKPRKAAAAAKPAAKRRTKKAAAVSRPAGKPGKAARVRAARRTLKAESPPTPKVRKAAPAQPVVRPQPAVATPSPPAKPTSNRSANTAPPRISSAPAPKLSSTRTGSTLPSARQNSTPVSRSNSSPVLRRDSRPAAPPKPKPPPILLIPADDGGEPIRMMPDDAPLPKTWLKKKQLDHFRRLLLERRATLTADVRQMSDEAFDRHREASHERSAMPLHMADVGTDNYEQEFTLGLIDSERALLREIDDALERIDEGTYGICLKTHRPIGLERLEAKPWARYCIEYTRLREQGRVS